MLMPASAYKKGGEYVTLLRSNVPKTGDWNSHGTVTSFEIVNGVAHVITSNQFTGIRAHGVLGYQSTIGRKAFATAKVTVISGSVYLFTGGAGLAVNFPVGPGQYDLYGYGTYTAAQDVYVSVLTNQSAPAEFYVSFGSLKEFNVALTDDGFKLYVSLVDSGGDQSIVRYDLVAATHADAVTAAGTILTRLGAVTDAIVKSYTINNVYIEDALTLPGTGVQVEQRATVICQIDSDPLKKVAINIPAPADGLFVGGPATGDGYNTIDTTDAALALYTDIWAVSGAIATISDGEYLSDAPILRGRRTHRQSSRG